MKSLYLNQAEFENIFKNHLKIETYSKPIESLFSLRNKNRIDYAPYYQRNYVWDPSKASYFIESIILGTEIPPLIFFNNGENTEIIDGRQRFETIQRFMDDSIKLKRKGLSALKHLENKSFNTLSDNVRDNFLDSTLRIIEFEIVNEPKLDPLLQDKVKKEIFGRYNSGITPLKRSEIDNAVYDNDDLTNIFKENLKPDSDLHSKIVNLFFRDTREAKPGGKGVPIEMIMQFVRRSLVQHLVPITYSAAGKKAEIFERLYNQLTDTQMDHQALFEIFQRKVDIVDKINEHMTLEDLPPNRLFLECLVWGINVLENENLEYERLLEPQAKRDISNYYLDHSEDFSDIDYAFYRKVIDRYNSIIKFMRSQFEFDPYLYTSASSESKEKVKNLLLDDENKDVLDQLESLRLNKPEPSRTSIEDITRMMNRRKFIVRPSYQRSEVINLTKASSIIESILLGIALPAIFVYKRENGVSEVIDGQQRILTILGYTGETYMNHDGSPIKPKNSGFSLRNPKILHEFSNKKFHQLPQSSQEKILDFELFLVSIEEKLNPDFDPIDLFIRLNDKPYPIKEHSFEMWNSWADKDVITAVKKEVDSVKSWFYVRSSDRKNYRDRMENEEMYISLTYLGYKTAHEITGKPLDIFQKELRLNARIGNKKDVTNIINDASTDDIVKANLLEQVRQTKSFIRKIRILLVKEHVVEQELNSYLKQELDEVFNRLGRRTYRRTFQDFYILWYIISPIPFEMLKKYRHQIRDELEELITFSKNMPGEFSDGRGYARFISDVEAFINKYKVDSRKLTLSNDEIKRLIEKQGNTCPLSKTPLFFGDEIEVDHIIPLAVGGKDDLDNLQIVHRDSNRSKGVKTDFTE